MTSFHPNLPKFEWDYDVPKVGFWKDIDYCLSRSFLQCYTESEIAEMNFDQSLSNEDKMTLLYKHLNTTLATKESTSRLELSLPLKESNNFIWRTILAGLGTIEYYRGHWEAEEKIARERYDSGPEGGKDISALQELSIVMERQGKYAEGESMAKTVLEHLDELPKLGRDSPQAIGSAVVLAMCVWKQGRQSEGNILLDDCTQRVRAMGEGKFAKYQEEERERLEQTRSTLEEWAGPRRDD